MSREEGAAGRSLKAWLQDKYCDHPLEQCQDTRLHNAACVGDIDTLRSLLQDERFLRGIDERAVWCSGWLPCSPLRIAATAGHADCVELLIRSGAQLELVDVKGQTPLYVAAENGHLECVKVLLRAGADPNGSPHNRSSPIYHAARVGRADILQELIKVYGGLVTFSPVCRYGADVDVDHQLSFRGSDSSPRLLTSLASCPLYISAAYHNLACFHLLLQAGANPDYNYWGKVSEENFPRGAPCCLLEAVLRHGCDQQFVQLLIDFGANLKLVRGEPCAEEHPRISVNTAALELFKEAKGYPRALASLCRIIVRRALGKQRLSSACKLPVPPRVLSFLLHELP
ncbi:ankyrin repeat and SOCS box protein 1 isoform X1 [Xenopus tropicalis]|uniref:Ankyrin repeat and SOCS box protein 1 isoform X1 n=1 Tax=Xenopus tropicalis TaxID=8364 RepID=F6TQ54_XENTR|nr:ankyrin repeat and SOCS box protein 1 isoform X1 [Xenopus tropicalis]|eukprot:XP_004917938.1 PREDICTED: ankyrin repeat and SOCS box protein 1 isoform X1 [Xenopus tropicalis]